MITGRLVRVRPFWVMLFSVGRVGAVGMVVATGAAWAVGAPVWLAFLVGAFFFVGPPVLVAPLQIGRAGLFTLGAWPFTTVAAPSLYVLFGRDAPFVLGTAAVVVFEWFVLPWLEPRWDLVRSYLKWRARWPTTWAEIANATEEVQASMGGGESPFGQVTKAWTPWPFLRHPALGLWPRFDFGRMRVSLRIFSPPGRDMSALEPLETKIASNDPLIREARVETFQEGDSWGRLDLWFALQTEQDDSIDAGFDESDDPVGDMIADDTVSNELED